MKTERKKLSMVAMANEAGGALRELFVERPSAWFSQARTRMRDLPKTNFDLGCDFADQGKWFDALFRFRVAAYFQPEYPQVWYNIGCCYFRIGKLGQAEAALGKALKQKPGQTEAIFMLAAINPGALPPGQRPQRMPTAMVGEFFGSIAQRYDIEEARNKYQAGKIIHELLKPLLKNLSPHVLDLGCGSGIVARPWRAAAVSITGVDSTAAMVALAEKATHAEKKLFDQLVTADIAALPMSIADASADLVLCINTAQFVGELQGLMQSAARVLTADGVFVLTIEPHNAATGFGLSATSGRFGHSPAYVKQVASAAGMKLVKETTAALYPDLPVPAYVFSKGGN